MKMYVKNKACNIIICVGMIILIIGFAIYGLYLMEDNNNKEYRGKDNYSQTNNIEITKKDISATTVYLAAELEPNSKLILSPGQTFKYKLNRPTRSVEGMDHIVLVDHSIVFFVDSITRINKTECYKIIGNETKSIEIMHGGKYTKTSSSFKYVLYIDTETGKPVQVNIENTTIEGQNASTLSLNLLCAMGKSFYAPWMLALKKDMKWEEYTIINEPVKQESHLEYKVLDIENINKRKCFKVSVRFSNKIENGQQSVTNLIMWVDVEKRILVRLELYSLNLYLGEINLIE